MSPLSKRRLPLSERRLLMHSLGLIVRSTGTELLKHWDGGTTITDTHDFHGHESSSIDALARQIVQAEIDRHMPNFEGPIRFELRPYTKIALGTGDHKKLVLIVDEIDGTTNAKRCWAAHLHYRPAAIISVAVSESESLRDIVASAVFTLDNSDLFTAIRVENAEFLTFHNGRLLSPADFQARQGDSRDRIYVIGYSNSQRQRKGETEQALYNQGFKIYEGCRASGMDVLNILRNGIDAYVDLRAVWTPLGSGGNTQSEAMLQTYDISGVIPIALGCGLVITDGHGLSWENYGLMDAISLVIARPGIHEQILETIRPLVEQWPPASP